MLHPGCHHPQRTGRGQSEWLVLLCRTLSFPIPNRFKPGAFPDPGEASPDALTPGTAFTVRGGNWFNDPALAGSASRSGAEPNTAMSLIGFRIVAESAPDKEE